MPQMVKQAQSTFRAVLGTLEAQQGLARSSGKRGAQSAGPGLDVVLTSTAADLLALGGPADTQAGSHCPACAFHDLRSRPQTFAPSAISLCRQ